MARKTPNIRDPAGNKKFTEKANNFFVSGF